MWIHFWVFYPVPKICVLGGGGGLRQCHNVLFCRAMFLVHAGVGFVLCCCAYGGGGCVLGGGGGGVVGCASAILF